MDASFLEVDVAAIRRNYRRLRDLVGPQTRICPVIKGNAYGMGASEVGRVLQQAGASMLAVYDANEALEVLESGVRCPILVLGPDPVHLRGSPLRGFCNEGRVHFTVHGLDHWHRIRSVLTPDVTPIPLHLEMDTGLRRGGTPLPEFEKLVRAIEEEPCVRLAGVSTHFVSSDRDAALTEAQHAMVRGEVQRLRGLLPEDLIVHVANSCATLADRTTHADMVRVGQAWAGFGVEFLSDGRRLPMALDLEPCLRWTTTLRLCKRVARGERVGYHGEWTADQDSVLGLVPVGYAAGWSPFLSGRDGQAAPQVRLMTSQGEAWVQVAGAVNMDQTVLDLGPALAAGLSPAVGDRVELITPNRQAPNHLVRLATQAGLRPYAIACGIHPSVPRAYVDGHAEIETSFPIREGVR